MTKQQIKNYQKEEDELWEEVNAGRADKHVVARLIEINLALEALDNQ